MANQYFRLQPLVLKQLVSLSARMQFLVSCYYGKVFGAESETSCLNTIMATIEDTELPLPAKKNAKLKL